jgi:hypothetical protein
MRFKIKNLFKKYRIFTRILGEPLRTLADFVGFGYSRRAVRSSPFAALPFSQRGFGASASIALARAFRAPLDVY